MERVKEKRHGSGKYAKQSAFEDVEEESDGESEEEEEAGEAANNKCIVF